MTLSLIVFIPLLGSLVSYLIGKTISKKLSGIIATLASFASLALVYKIFSTTENYSYPLTEKLFDWLLLPGLAQFNAQINFSLMFDQLSAVMCLVITGVGSLIHLYAIGYMSEDQSQPRFFAYLNLFLFFMLLLVLGSNLLILFIGWEGVGLCSYLLIGFWHENIDYAKAGKKAFIYNRIGDAAFLIGIFILLLSFGTLEFAELKSAITESQIIGVGSTIISLACLFLFIGATGKSAQIPLFVWLPDAMAGPTPVSALIHAATMVTAGLYLLARLNFIYILAPMVLMIITVVACATAVISALIALTQNDIKKVLAYSTVSQLGFMFMAAGAGAYAVAIFHVVTHAFFKACLFLCAGSVIHGCHHEQDMRKMGGLAKKMPITFITYLIATIAIAGIFPFAGYQSKHLILQSLDNTFSPTTFLYLLKAASFLTAFYMTRSLVLTFFGSYRGSHRPHESPLVMTLPLIILAIFSSVAGYYLVDKFMEYLVAVIPLTIKHHHETVLEALKHSSLGIAGVLCAFCMYGFSFKVPNMLSRFFAAPYKLSLNKFYIDELYALFVGIPLKAFSNFLWKFIDIGTIDATVNGTAQIVEVSGEIARYCQTGQTRGYVLWLLSGIVIIIVFCFMV